MTNSSLNGSTGLTAANGLLYNITSPSITSSYSILSYADSIKKSPSSFQYMIEAGKRGELGGIWTANSTYSFTSTSNANTNITLNREFGNWVYSDSGVEARMPWITNSNSCGWLTTSLLAQSEWWGTLISSDSTSMNNWLPIPWMCDNKTQCSNPGASGTIYSSASSNSPGIIWYWVR